MKEGTIRVGIGVMILREGKVLLGERVNSHGDGEYCFPGGHLEYMEGYEACARRETKEETGLELDTVSFQLLGNVTEYPPTHYIQVGMLATSERGDPQTLEPEKIRNWAWYDLDELPAPLFGPCITQVECYKTDVHFYDKK